MSLDPCNGGQGRRGCCGKRGKRGLLGWGPTDRFAAARVEKIRTWTATQLAKLAGGPGDSTVIIVGLSIYRPPGILRSALLGPPPLHRAAGAVATATDTVVHSAARVWV
jgi:hypothetical protein